MATHDTECQKDSPIWVLVCLLQVPQVDVVHVQGESAICVVGTRRHKDGGEGFPAGCQRAHPL